MPLAEDVVEDLYEGRSIAGEEGFRPYTVALIHRAADATNARLTTLISETPIVEANGQPPKVRWLKAEEIVVGGLTAGTIEIGPITPKFSGGGTDFGIFSLAEGGGQGDHVYLKITGPMCPNGDTYRITSKRHDRSLRIMIQAEPVEQGAAY